MKAAFFFKTILAREEKLSVGFYRYIRSVISSFFKIHYTIAEGKQGVVLTHTYIIAGMMFCTPLSHDNITCNGLLASKYLNAEPFTF